MYNTKGISVSYIIEGGFFLFTSDVWQDRQDKGDAVYDAGRNRQKKKTRQTQDPAAGTALLYRICVKEKTMHSPK